MADMSFKEFTDIYDIPYSIVTILYMATVLLFAIVVISFRVKDLCCKRKTKQSEEIELSEKGAPKTPPPQEPQQQSYLSRRIEQFNSWLVRLVFGKSEGVSEEEKEEEKKDDNLQVGQDVYINNVKMKTIDVNIFGVIIICFGLLVAISTYSTYLLEVTHICSDNTAIYCFPLILDPGSLELLEVESVLSQPISDCSVWTNSSIAPFVTFQCFRYAYNADAALAVAGGLLAFFTIVMRTTLSIITKVFKTCKLYKCPVFTNTVQAMVAIFLLLVDLTAALVVLAFQLLDSLGMVETETHPVAQLTAAYIADNGIQLVVATGTIALLLLIPWTYYTNTDTHSNTPANGKKKSKV